MRRLLSLTCRVPVLLARIRAQVVPSDSVVANPAAPQMSCGHLSGYPSMSGNGTQRTFGPARF